MATKRPTQRKQPFVIEPLNWVAPNLEEDDTEKTPRQAKGKRHSEKQNLTENA